MHILFCTDWDKVDLDEVVGHDIVMPDGSRRFIEMSYLHWYALEFMMKRGHTTQGLAKDIIEIIERNNGSMDDFSECFQTGLLSYISSRVKSEQERDAKRR